MSRILPTFALAYLQLFAAAVTQGGFPASSSLRKLLQATGGGATTLPSTAGVYTTISTGQATVQCSEWSQASGSWDVPRGGRRYEAAGSTPPSKQLLPKIEQQICADARAASQALLAALAAGGEQAQAWVFALFNADCAEANAPSDVYQFAIDLVNSGDPADLPTTASFFAALVQAADAVGIPVCATVAVVDDSDGAALQQTVYHTGAA